MKRIDIDLRFWSRDTGQYHTEPWSAYETPIPGLVVCRKPRWTWLNMGAKGQFDGDPRVWQVVHKPTGWPLSKKGTPTRKKALWIVDELPKLDWQQEQGEITRIQGLFTIVQALHQEVWQ